LNEDLAVPILGKTFQKPPISNARRDPPATACARVSTEFSAAPRVAMFCRWHRHARLSLANIGNYLD